MSIQLAIADAASEAQTVIDTVYSRVAGLITWLKLLASNAEFGDALDDVAQEVWLSRKHDADPCDSTPYKETAYKGRAGEYVEVSKLRPLGDVLEHNQSYNFVFGVVKSGAASSKYVLRVGRGRPGTTDEDIENGIKHFQLCSGNGRNGVRNGPLLMAFAGVMHRINEFKVVVAPLSGRWANLKYDYISRLNQLYNASNGAYAHNPFAPIIARGIADNGDDVDFQNVMLDALMTAWFVSKCAETSPHMEFDICWKQLVKDYIRSVMRRYDSDDACWKEVPDRYRIGDD